ncbi:type II toxin-antitoxin system RelE/ParE family toxin [Piscinibacter terrae]|uniref:Type II toxin-antitoxin system RelE/ParE family toxin n=1 Tax=Piscinibacter terrae TaxID=2496871 RepID=A0A3N7HQA3_9BURK|nr:type II toxin-antitoxin system RelE/ParE family toxin [Albitalea terrae]RQP24380.1 type II toxin-antitoxin system RelE/ParE family toxin [Albitalea terrae]
MTSRLKPLVRLQRAEEDVVAALEYLLEEAPHSASNFVDSLEQAYRHIQRAPATGSPRFAHELNVPGLRSWQCRKFPYVVFYMEHPQRIDIWRVLHSSRDIPAHLLDVDAKTSH